ncbi:hypothetical protein JXO52_07225 [bacterium]|nr:hypothetical protein [bacterium]
MSGARTRRLAALVWTVACLSAVPCRSQTWSSRCRLSAALEHDSNIFETEEHPLGSASWQGAAYLSVAGRALGRISLSGDYQGGVKLYPGHAGENRVSHNAAVTADAPLRPDLGIFLDAHLFLRQFCNDLPGIRRIVLSPGLRWHPAPRARVRVFASGIAVDYRNGEYYDYREYQAGAELRIVPSAVRGCFLRGTAGLRRYGRHAFLYDPVHYWRQLDDLQKDEFIEILAGAEVYCIAFIRLSAGMRWQRSNSFGYRYRQPLLSLTAARHLVEGTILTLYASLRLRRYGDDIDPALQTRPGSEGEENSYLLIDISHTLNERTTVHMRAGRYLDESPIASIYYAKNIISVGVSQRL